MISTVHVEEFTAAAVVSPADPNSSAAIPPYILGDYRIMARGDLHAFVAEVKRFGFCPDDFRLNIKRLLGTQPVAAPAASFAVTVQSLRAERADIYLGGPGRAWVVEFLVDLMAGAFGKP